MMRFLYNQNTGLFIIRLVVGLSLLSHGWPKIAGGSATWEKLGMSMQYLGIGFLPAFWGFMAAISEFIGGLCVALGLFTKTATFFAGSTMFVAFIYHIGKGDGMMAASHPLELAAVFTGLFFIGPGKFSLDFLINKIKS